VFPICATLFRQGLQGFLNEHPLIHLSTFGGSDVGCVVGQRALDVYEREEPWKNAAAAGERLTSALTSLAEADPAAVKGVSGLGLLLGVRLEDEEAARLFCRALAADGVLAMPGMVARDTVVLRPSLLVTDAEIDRIAAACAAAAEAVAADRTRAATPGAEAKTGTPASPAAERPAAGETGRDAAPGERPAPAAAVAADESVPTRQPVARPRRKRAPKAGDAGTAAAKATPGKPAGTGAPEQGAAKPGTAKPRTAKAGAGRSEAATAGVGKRGVAGVAPKAGAKRDAGSPSSSGAAKGTQRSPAPTPEPAPAKPKKRSRRTPSAES
jgi:hypothetical protein